MSLASLEKLMFTVGIHDLTSQPAKNINRTMQSMKQNATSGFDAIRGGAFGLAGAGFAIKTFMQPVYDFKQALGEVRSLEVAQKELDTLTQASLDFSTQYGESASEFVRSSYDIQSAIGGLVDGELAKFTTASNILAKATKADAGTITNYMGTMYGIFKDQAETMGKAQWVEMLTGQTAAAVQMFKTTGQEMSGAFTSVGANATASGVALNEQMAILGTLQSTMSGSEAGTKYKAFLAGVAKAQDSLGLSFTDSQGRLLPMVQILDKLNGKFGETMTEAEGLQLKKAFGSDEAVSMIKLLMGQTDGLQDSINKLGSVKGMDDAQRMAKQMIDPWEQFHAVTEAVRISFGTALMPTINELLSTLNGGLQSLVFYTQEFPNITRWVGLLTLAMLGMSAATGLFSILLGLGRTALAAWGMGVILAKGAAYGLFGMLAKLRAMLIWVAIAVYLNPFTILVVSILAVIGVVGHLLGWWGKLYDAFANTEFGKTIIAWFEKIKGYVSDFAGWFGMGDGLNATAEMKQTQVNENLNKSLGVGKAFAGDMPKMDSIKEETRIDSLSNVSQKQTSVESIKQTMFSGLSGEGGAQFGDVYINAENGMSPENLENWQALQGG